MKKGKPYAIAVRIYNKNNIVMADIKTSPIDDSTLETIVWTHEKDREKFYYNGYTLYYDEREKKSFYEV